ncbi:MAG: TetR family transcriptional regulator [Glaciihabitans sp.]|nr:TetR family transcriptional regulator [Glaciihabitans sp.]
MTAEILPFSNADSATVRNYVRESRETREKSFRNAARVNNRTGTFGQPARLTNASDTSDVGAWGIATIEAGARSQSTSAEGILIAVFDVMDNLFNDTDFQSRAFLAFLSDITSGRVTSADHANFVHDFRALVGTLASEASLSDIEEFGRSWQILMNGAINKAIEGDAEAAQRARVMAADLIVRHRTVSFVAHPVVQQPSDNNALDFDSYFDDDIFGYEINEVASHVGGPASRG